MKIQSEMLDRVANDNTNRGEHTMNDDMNGEEPWTKNFTHDWITRQARENVVAMINQDIRAKYLTNNFHDS